MVYTINCSMPQNSQQQGRKCMTIDKWQWPLLKSAPCFTLMNLLTSQIKFTSRRQHLKDEGGSVTKSCLTLVTPWTIACRVPLFMGFSRQENWSRLPFPSPGESSWPRNWTQVSCMAGRFFTDWAMRDSWSQLLGKLIRKWMVVQAIPLDAAVCWEALTDSHYLTLYLSFLSALSFR